MKKRLQFYLSVCFMVSFSIFLISFFLYVYFTKLNISSLLLGSYSFFLVVASDTSTISYFSFDMFGFVLLFLAYCIGIITLLTLDARFYWKNLKFSFAIQFFTIIVYLYVSTQNLLLFFV